MKVFTLANGNLIVKVGTRTVLCVSVLTARLLYLALKTYFEAEAQKDSA